MFAPRRAPLAALALLALAACERKVAPRPDDSSVTGSSVSIATPPPPDAPRVSGWNGDAGRALFVHGDNGEAIVVVPGQPGDSSTDASTGSAETLLPAEVSLFNRAGTTGRAKAELVAAGADGKCTRWPTARLAPATGESAVPAWTVGFAGASATPLGLDSLETASQPDSSGLAAAVTRLASGLKDDTVRALRGVPFRVRSARRFSLPGGQQGVVAVLSRALNEEASPIGEQILLVAERPAPAAGTPAAPWALAYHERDSGLEDELIATEVLAAVALGTSQRPTLVLARAMPDGNRYSLLERTSDHAWRIRWSSVEGGC